jgi:hypothetical protein
MSSHGPVTQWIGRPSCRLSSFSPRTHGHELYGSRGSEIVLRPNALVNLYHRVFGEPHYRRNSIGLPLPVADLPYDTDEGLSTALTPGGTGG